MESSNIISALGKRPLSTTSFSNAYAEGRGAPPTTDQTISIDRNIRRRLTTVPSHNTVDATALLALSKLYVHTDMMQDVVTQELYSSRTGLRSASMPHEDISRTTVCKSALPTVNHAYLCLDSNGCIIRPEVISFLNRAEETRCQGHIPAEYPGDHTQTAQQEVITHRAHIFYIKDSA
nr:hypothetical protein [Tanacetum cinerariifolium]